MSEDTVKQKKNPRNPAIERRSASRMLAVQAIYQNDFLKDKTQNNDETQNIINAEILYKEMLAQLKEEKKLDEPEFISEIKPDKKFLQYLISGVCERQNELDEKIEEALGKRWLGGRLTELMQSILRAASFEITQKKIHKNTIINEYVTITASFYSNPELGLMNGLLQELTDKL